MYRWTVPSRMRLVIGIGKVKGQLMQRPLETVIEEAEAKGLATPEEIDEMRQALATLKANAPDETSLSTSMAL